MVLGSLEDRAEPVSFVNVDELKATHPSTDWSQSDHGRMSTHVWALRLFTRASGQILGTSEQGGKFICQKRIPPISGDMRRSRQWYGRPARERMTAIPSRKMAPRSKPALRIKPSQQPGSWILRSKPIHRLVWVISRRSINATTIVQVYCCRQGGTIRHSYMAPDAQRRAAQAS